MPRDGRLNKLLNANNLKRARGSCTCCAAFWDTSFFFAGLRDYYKQHP